MRLGSLCTGILGLDLAVAAHFDAELVWFSEIEPGPLQVIKREHPGVPNIGDLTTVDWSDLEPIDVLTAGYPCQPFSHAGHRKGTDDTGRLNPVFVEWMMGYPEGWTADLTRTQALKALGNAVVPQQAAAALIELAA